MSSSFLTVTLHCTHKPLTLTQTGISAIIKQEVTKLLTSLHFQQHKSRKQTKIYNVFVRDVNMYNLSHVECKALLREYIQSDVKAAACSYPHADNTAPGSAAAAWWWDELSATRSQGVEAGGPPGLAHESQRWSERPGPSTLWNTKTSSDTSCLQSWTCQDIWNHFLSILTQRAGTEPVQVRWSGLVYHLWCWPRVWLLACWEKSGQWEWLEWLEAQPEIKQNWFTSIWLNELYRYLFWKYQISY